MNPGKRLCCLYIPDICLQARLEELDDAENTPVALLYPPRTRAPSSRVKVVAANKVAQIAGVELGMSLTQAEIACDTLHCWDRDEDYAQTLSQGILEALYVRFPVVEMASHGLFFVGTRGLSYLYGDERAILKALRACVSELGFTSHAAAAANRFTALTFAKWNALNDTPTVSIIKTGQEKQALAPLPITLLPAKERLFEKLRPLGLHTLGDFSALKRESVERRFSSEGVQLHRWASGEDNNHINAPRSPQQWQRHLDLDEPITQADGLIFLLAPIIQDLIQALIRDGRACAALSLDLDLDDSKRIHIPLETGAPTENPKLLLDLLRLKLAKIPLPSGVVAISLEIRRATEPSHGQQDLFLRKSSATGLTSTISRLQNALGEAAIVMADSEESWLPGGAFSYKKPNILALQGKKKGRKKGVAPPKKEGPALQAGLRHFLVPRSLFVKKNGQGHPLALRMGRTQRRVFHTSGPFFFSGGWWEETYNRSYYRLWLDNNSEVLIYSDLSDHTNPEGEWYLEGVYD